MTLRDIHNTNDEINAGRPFEQHEDTAIPSTEAGGDILKACSKR